MARIKGLLLTAAGIAALWLAAGAGWPRGCC